MTDEYVINPKKNRPVRIGSRTHRHLISDAINKSNNTIDRVHQLISKNTERKGDPSGF